MPKHCLALRHLAFEDLGTAAEPLRAAGYTLHYLDVGVEPIDRAALQGADLLVVLGGPIGVYEEAAYPFLIDETAAIRQRLEAGGPTLGICLGAQLIAAALGADVRPGPQKEIGWAEVTLSAAGLGSVLAPLQGVPVLHWHGDQLSLPPSAECLASTAICPNQAFRIGERVLGLQFHIEVDPARIEQWLIGHTLELHQAGIDIVGLREQSLRQGPATAAVGRRIIASWLAALPSGAW